MLVKTTVHEPRQIERNIQLPYYAKSANGEFFRINENESVLKISLIEGFSYQMSLNLKTTFTSAHALDQAISAQPCGAEEVEDAVRKYLDYVGAIIEILSESV